MGGHPAALGNHGDAALPGGGFHLGKRQGQTDLQVDETQAIRSHQAHIIVVQGGPDLLFQGPSGLVQFRETGGFHHDPSNPQFTAFSHQGGHDPGRRQDGHQVHRLGQVG